MNLTNKIFSCVFLTLIAIVTKAQTKGAITYRYTVNDNLMPSMANYIVYFNDFKSIELGVKSNLKSGEVNDNTGMLIVEGKEPFVYKDFNEKKLVTADYLGAKTKLIMDTLLNFKWTITREKKKIMKFNCTKAQVQFRGRNYIAWFTEDIPIQNGPWKFCGLPGLIVKVDDSMSIFSWELTGITLKAKFDKSTVAIPREYNEDKGISHKQFIALYNRMVANNKKMAKVVETGKDGGWVSRGIMLPPKMELF
ncbi:GLPGLI family protein [Pedobacter sp. KBS0701]|uniref:GLPGLI family protein n=1 Tax=Pedobacter sp. KBS0701 TaxID=2578106 RepID=UPI00110DF3C5|nr:GLPGLI family protein [Pedobacter sp. KBS0701]QDW26160.1 GLPGLI family protein [Pedobacter sp. KBS0701]